ncbi:phosphohydrolase [Nocardia altamirensis]|uniref:phosphohydrolase n=1 Tax=Nocardia altamirensis TaxID=472158 RepID=UPI00084074C7|nr:phosphohydrolase [Nocardia altamirensis]
MGAPADMDWEWARRTGGNLSPRQRGQLTLRLLGSIPSLLSDQLRLRLGIRGSARLDLDNIQLPDTRLAREVEVIARAELSPHMLEHSFRTYFLGRVLAAVDGVAFDDELVYVCSLLHDISFETPTPGRCFAVVSAERAVLIAEDNGALPERASAIGAGIAAHITAGAQDNLADPGGFVGAGAGADLYGLRLSQIDPAWVADLLRRHPRRGFKALVAEGVRREAAAVPQGRTALMASWGLERLIHLAPFAE